MKVELDYNPHPGQKLVHNSKARFRVLSCGRRWGKTLCAVNETIVQATKKNNATCWIVAPVYSQAMVSWRMLRKILLRTPLVKRWRISENYVELVNGSTIFIRSADNPDNLRSEGLDFCVLDECAWMQKEVWEESLRPALADKKGSAMFISTPKGLNWFYEKWLEGQDKTQTIWESWKFSTDSNPHIDAEELKELCKLPDHIYRQEILAEFLSDSGEVFRKVDDCIISTSLSEPKPEENYIMGVDLARFQDFTVLLVINSSGEIVYFDRFGDTLWEVQKLRIINIAQKYHAKVILDKTGIGQPIWEELLNETDMNLIGYNISGNKEKNQLIEDLALSIENKKVKWEKSLEILTLELKFFGMTRLKSGRLRYGAPEGHFDDCVVALALANYGREIGTAEWGIKDIQEFYMPRTTDHWGRTLPPRKEDKNLQELKELERKLIDKIY